MTHYPPSKIQSDPKSPGAATRPNPGKAATPTSNGDKPRDTLADGVSTGGIQPGKTQGANRAG